MRIAVVLLSICTLVLIGSYIWTFEKIYSQPSVNVVGGPVYDAGTVSAKLPIVHVFKILNPHSFSVGIATPTAGCTCTTATASAQTIPPHGTVNVKLEVDPEDGNITGSASIVTTHGRNSEETWLFVTGKAPATI